MKIIYNDIGTSWALSNQNESTPISIGIVDLHNKIMYYLIIIFFIVFYFIIYLSGTLNNSVISRIKFFNHNITRWIEFIWTIIPAIILIIIAIPSFKLLYSLENEDWTNPSLTVKITGAQWFWNYELSDISGLNINFDSYTKLEEDLNFGDFRLLDVDAPLYLPIHTPIRLLVTSQDVIHSFSVPSCGVKIDAVPGRINHFSLFLLRNSFYTGSCMELCGTSHNSMSIIIKGVSNTEFKNWLETFNN